jgi:hypothetical protein
MITPVSSVFLGAQKDFFASAVASGVATGEYPLAGSKRPVGVVQTIITSLEVTC